MDQRHQIQVQSTPNSSQQDPEEPGNQETD